MIKLELNYQLAWARNTSSPSGRLGGAYSFIGCGQNNKICAGSCYSSIIGGQNNIVQHSWATVSGYNVTTAMDCAFHANDIVLQNIPFGNPVTCAPPGTAVPGQLYYVVVPPGGFCQVWIA